MTKEQFFELPKEQRKSLIAQAHEYYASGFNENLSKVKEAEVRDFITMCIESRNQQAKEEVSLFQC